MHETKINKLLPFVICLLIPTWVTAQQTQATKSSKTEEPKFKVLDKQPLWLDSTSESENSEYTTFTVPRQPEFPWIRGTLERYITVHLRYPENALKSNVSGMVIVSFIVAKDGSITNTKIEKSLNLDCDKEAIRLVKSMPRWIPGDQVRYYLPIQFSLPQK